MKTKMNKIAQLLRAIADELENKESVAQTVAQERRAPAQNHTTAPAPAVNNNEERDRDIISGVIKYKAVKTSKNGKPYSNILLDTGNGEVWCKDFYNKTTAQKGDRITFGGHIEKFLDMENFIIHHIYDTESQAIARNNQEFPVGMQAPSDPHDDDSNTAVALKDIDIPF